MQIRLGYDTYSLRSLGWDAMQHLTFAASQGLDAIQFSSVKDFGDLSPESLRIVKARAESLGIRIDGGVGCVCELSKNWNPKDGSPRQVLEQGLDVANQVGAKAMRCVMGSQTDRFGGKPLEPLMEGLVRNLKSVRLKALGFGVKIAIENHKDLQAWQLKEVIEAAGKDFVGANLDFGNPNYLMENPLTTMETLGPYAVTTHVRDSAVYEVPDGAAVQWTALGDGNVDFKAIVARYKELCPEASFQLEIITGRTPEVLPYLDPRFWKTFEGMPAADFASFVALAKSGKPFSGRMVIEDAEGKPPAPEFHDALVYQQRYDLERSFAYAKQVLGIGKQSTEARLRDAGDNERPGTA
jgi:3-oxoisoapionate decarboxylase